jgi:hypothetical protein
LLLLFPTSESFNKFELEGLFEQVKHQIDKYDIYIKLLVKGQYHKLSNSSKNKLVSDSGLNPVRDDGNITESEFLEKEKNQQSVELQFTNELDTRMLTIIVDRDKLLAIEIQNDSGVKLADSLGLATYSNSMPTVMSYYSVFETSWMQSQIRRNQN